MKFYPAYSLTSVRFTGKFHLSGNLERILDDRKSHLSTPDNSTSMSRIFLSLPSMQSRDGVALQSRKFPGKPREAIKPNEKGE